MNERKDLNITDEKIDGDGVDIISKNKFLTKLDNFWFHYKWPVIIGAFFLIVFIIGVVQIFSREQNDVAVTFAGPAYVSPNQSEEIKAELAKILPEDYSGDGKKIVKFQTYSIYSEDEIASLGGDIDLSQNSTNRSNYDDYLNAGECSIYFISGYLFDNLKTHNRLQSMSDIFGEELPEGVTDDGYAVRLKDLPIYEIDAFKALPEDTYVCLTKPYIYGESSKSDTYKQMIEYFKAIVNFG